MNSPSTPDIASWYTAILLREPSASEIGFWEAELSSGRQSSKDAIAAFLESPEYASNVLPVMMLYQAGLGRIPDLEGLRSMSALLASGQSKAALTEAFIQSPEFGRLFGNANAGPSSSDLVVRLFQNTFGKDPSPSDIAIWSATDLSPAELLSAFMQSGEALERLTLSSQLISAFLAIEGRLPTLAELQAAINAGGLMQMISGLLADLFGSEVEQPSVDVDAGDSDPTLPQPTLTISFDLNESTDLTAQSDLDGFLVMSSSGQRIAELVAGEPIDLNELPMLGELTTSTLIARSDAGVQSVASLQVLTLGTTENDELDATLESAIQYVFTGDGEDTINGGSANDYLAGGDGNDTIRGHGGDDFILGGNGNDSLFGGDREDYIDGGDGEDTIEGGPGADSLDGGDGIDTLSYADVHSANVHGLTGIAGMAINFTTTPLDLDLVIGFLDDINETMLPGSLGDTVEVWRGLGFSSDVNESPLVLDPNTAAYLRSFSRPDDDDFLEPLVAPEGPRDHAIDFEVIVGSALNDLIFTEGDYEINAGRGNDVIFGTGTNLILRGGEGNDVLIGGGSFIELEGEDGDDLIFVAPVSFEGEDSPSVITGGRGADSVVMFGGENTLVFYAQASNDDDVGGYSDSNAAQQDTIYGFNEDDYFVFNLTNLSNFNFSVNSVVAPAMLFDGDLPEDYFGIDPYVDFLMYAVDTNSNDDLNPFDGEGDLRILILDVFSYFGGEDDIDLADLTDFFHERTFLHLTGTDDNDFIVGGSNADTIYGGNGEDYIDGGDGDDTLYGGDGEDFIDGGEGNNTIEGGAGSDFILLGSGSNTVVINAVADNGVPGESGSSDSNQFGQDTISGFDDGDYLVLNLSNLKNFLYSEDITITFEIDRHFYTVNTNFSTDGDLTSGSSDVEIVVLGSSDLRSTLIDRTFLNLSGTDGEDFITGGPNNDTISGGGGEDSIYGGDGDDELIGGDGNDVLNGEDGNDSIDGGGGNNTIEGGTGSDFIILEGGSNAVIINAVADNGFGEPGSSDSNQFGRDTINGFDDDDYLVLNLSNLRDFLYSADVDLTFDDAADSYLYTINTNYLTDGDLTSGSSDVEIVVLGPSDLRSTLIDRTIFNLSGTDGEDNISGGDNNDTINGENGADTIYGGGGEDSISGGDGSDVLFGEDGADTIYGGGGEDSISGGDGNDTLYGGDGDDELIGGDGIDFIDGGDGNDALSGDDGADTVYGGGGDDSIGGGDGNDTLYGDDGDDTIEGGAGADNLIGGSGSDTFVYEENSTGISLETADTIADFSGGDDLISTGISGYISSAESFWMESGSTWTDFNQFTERADEVFGNGIEVYLAYDLGFLEGNALVAMDGNDDDQVSAGDSVVVLVGVDSESSISGTNFIA